MFKLNKKGERYDHYGWVCYYFSCIRNGSRIYFMLVNRY